VKKCIRYRVKTLSTISATVDDKRDTLSFDGFEKCRQGVGYSAGVLTSGSPRVASNPHDIVYTMQTL
jgi:hypothetical protein